MKDTFDLEWRDRVARRGEPADGWYHMICDERQVGGGGFPKPLFGLHDVEESADVRVIRVTMQQYDDFMFPMCPSSSPKVLTNEREVNVRIACHEEKTLFDLLYEVHEGRRLLDVLEEKLDQWISRKSELAYLVDIYFSRFSRTAR